METAVFNFTMRIQRVHVNPYTSPLFTLMDACSIVALNRCLLLANGRSESLHACVDNAFMRACACRIVAWRACVECCAWTRQYGGAFQRLDGIVRACVLLRVD